MGCRKCSGKGYLEGAFFYGEEMHTTLKQCDACNDVAAYSKEVQKRYAKPQKETKEVQKESKPGLVLVTEIAKILPFRPKRD